MRKTFRSVRLGLAAVAVTSVLVLSGCGGGSGDGSLLETFAQAAEITGAAETVHIKLEVQFDDVPGADGITVVTEGESTIDGKQSRLTMTQLGQEIEALVVDETYYYKFPGLPDGKTWARLTFDEVQEATGLDVAAATNQNPTEVLARLAASGEIEKIGDEEIDGVATTHYRAVVDIEAMNEQSGVASDKALEQMKALFGPSYPADIWIDDDGYLRRMTFAIDLANAPDPPSGTPAEGRIVIEMTMSAFGEPIDVIAPPEEDVIDFADLD
jgi:hypothetical protein